MASFDFDQAEGLRRILAGSRPRVFTVLSATSDDERNAVLVNLSASLVRAGSRVLLLDACAAPSGVAARLDAIRGTSLMKVARGESPLNDAIHAMPQGFAVVVLTHGDLNAHVRESERQGLDAAFSQLVAANDIVVVAAELREDDSFPVQAMAEGEIVLQVSSGAASIKSAYSIIKRLNSRLGRRPFSILVTGASEQTAQVVYQNMAQAASRYLAVQLNSIGSVPADEHLTRAAQLGRAVVDAFPLAGASVAFRRLAGYFVQPEAEAGGFPGMQASGTNLGF